MNLLTKKCHIFHKHLLRAHLAAHSCSQCRNCMLSVTFWAGQSSQFHKTLQKTTNMLKSYKKTIESCVSRSEKWAKLYNLYKSQQEEIAYQKNKHLRLPKRKANEEYPYCKPVKTRKLN